MSKTIMIAEPLASRISQTITELKHVLTSLTNQTVRIAHSKFIDIALAPKDTVQITTADQLKHIDSPFRLKHEMKEHEIQIAYTAEKGLLIIAGSESVVANACNKFMLIVREQCTKIQDRKPRFEELFWTGSIQNVDYTM